MSRILATAGLIVGAVLVAILLHHLLRRLARRSSLAADIEGRAYPPAVLIAGLGAAWLALPAGDGSGWEGPLRRLVALAAIGCTGWLLGALLHVVADGSLRRYDIGAQDNLAARRMHTQVTVLRRVAFAVIAVLTIGAMLMTFPQARAAGASVFASAGLVGIVAALAAQSTLSNIFAGLQLAFGDALRLDDVVVVEGEWGRVEEMTLGYVVVRVWDERRLILPSSYFTAKPFQNWTRTEASVLGTVEIDVDWSMPVDEMREALRRIVDSDAGALWDGRVCALQVTGATGGTIRLRALVSAANGPALWDLRCLVRERLVGWVQERRPGARPRVRADIAAAGQDGRAADQDGRAGGTPSVPWQAGHQ
jgi:small-conductance mechanosensitive channel